MKVPISRNWIRLTNYGVMIFGHCIIVWSPETWYLRLGDYFCYPVFAFLAGVGLKETSDLGKYVSMMILLAVISQYPFEMAGVALPGKMNIMYSLAISVCIVAMTEEFKNSWPLILGLAGALFTRQYAIVEGVLIVYIVNEFYAYMPKFKKGNLQFSKYWLYSIYPGHLAIIGVLRRLI